MQKAAFREECTSCRSASVTYLHTQFLLDRGWRRGKTIWLPQVKAHWAVLGLKIFNTTKSWLLLPLPITKCKSRSSGFTFLVLSAVQIFVNMSNVLRNSSLVHINASKIRPDLLLSKRSRNANALSIGESRTVSGNGTRCWNQLLRKPWWAGVY